MVCPYRDTGAGQPLAIWQGSLVGWLASHLDRSAHTHQPPPWRLKTEALFSMLAQGGLWSLRASDLTVLQAPHTVALEVKEPHRLSYLKMDEVDDRACNQTFKRLPFLTSVNCEFEFFLFLYFLATCSRFALLAETRSANARKEYRKREK